MSKTETLDPTFAYNVAKRCRERATPYRDQAGQNKFAWDCYAASTAPASGFTPARKVEISGPPKRNLLRGRHGEIVPARRPSVVI